MAQSPFHEHCTRRTRVCSNQRFMFWLMAHPRWPPWTILCCGLSCSGRRVGQDHPGRLKHGPIAKPWAVYKTHPPVLKSVACFQFLGAPKMTPLINFWCALILCKMSQMCHKPAQFVVHWRLFVLFFGSSQLDMIGCQNMAISSLVCRYDTMSMYVNVNVCACIAGICILQVYACICMYVPVCVCKRTFSRVSRPKSLFCVFSQVSLLHVCTCIAGM
jgi:hypothetical protein